MSKIVVGMNIKPAINPHKIDCGFLKTTPKAFALLFSHPAGCSVAPSLGIKKKSTTPISKPATPIPIQKWFHARPPPIIGPTTNCPADPPAIPNIWVAPIRVAACEAGKFLVAI